MEDLRNKMEAFPQTDEFPLGYGYSNGSGNCSGNGYSDGSGNGDGNGYGYGFTDGDGNGYGFTDGDGYGDGYGYGSNNNIKFLNGQKIYTIDSITTLIDSVHNNYAKGRILNDDLTTSSCYIAKMGNFFAHGETLKRAFADVFEKFTNSKPIEERIAEFNRKFPENDVPYPASDMFSWHHILTGSCLMGRKQFCKQRGLDYENGKYTVAEFISLTKDAYRGKIIKQLESSRS